MSTVFSHSCSPFCIEKQQLLSVKAVIWLHLNRFEKLQSKLEQKCSSRGLFPLKCFSCNEGAQEKYPNNFLDLQRISKSFRENNFCAFSVLCTLRVPVHVWMNVNVHVSINRQTCLCVNTGMCVNYAHNTSVHVCAFIYAWMCKWEHTCAWAVVYGCSCVSACTHADVCIFSHAWVGVCTHTNLWVLWCCVCGCEHACMCTYSYPPDAFHSPSIHTLELCVGRVVPAAEIMLLILFQRAALPVVQSTECSLLWTELELFQPTMRNHTDTEGKRHRR